MQAPHTPAMVGDVSPPTAIAGLETLPSRPLEFSRAWLGKMAAVGRRRAELKSEGRLDGMMPAELAAEGAALTGTLRVPVIPVAYANVRPPFAEEVLERRLFGSAAGDTVSYRDYWREVSGGLLDVEGEVAPWIRLPRDADHYLPPEAYGWAQFGRMRDFRKQVVSTADAHIDFGQFDNDGPDGIPNSGDDDGYVDFVAFLYAVDCASDWRAGAIWPHRGAMPPHETDDISANGGRIVVADYIIHPVSDLRTCAPLQSGVFAHETGHAFGLPDLYDYDGSSQGIGAWGLMGTGSHSALHSPAHPSAWTKEQLGWVGVRWIGRDGASLAGAAPGLGPARDAPGATGTANVEPGSGGPATGRAPASESTSDRPTDPDEPRLLGTPRSGADPAGADRVGSDGSRANRAGARETGILEVPPVARERVVYRYDIPGGDGRYLLLENRQPIGTDGRLPGSGLLVWRIDPERGELRAWNSDENRAAIELLEADDQRDLARGRPADAGDPFPGWTERRSFSLGPPDAFRLDAIEELEGVIRAEVSLDHAAPALSPETPTVELATLTNGSRVTAHVPIHRQGGATGGWTVRGSAKWLRALPRGDELVIEADPSGLAPGAYTARLDLMLEGEHRAAGRVDVHLSVPMPGVARQIAAGLPWSWGIEATDGRVLQASYAWDPIGLRRRPRLFQVESGQPYPRTLARLPADALYQPRTMADGTTFVLARAQGENYLYRVSPDGSAAVVAELDAAPAYGLAPLPSGDLLVAFWDGRIHRVSPDRGTVHPWTELPGEIYQIATDARGNVYAAGYDGAVIRIDPLGRRSRIDTGFGRGRLVALSVTPGGEIFVGERGGDGRIVRIGRDGRRQRVTSVPRAEYFGLANDGPFLYALDLHHAQLLRIAVDSVSAPTVATQPTSTQPAGAVPPRN